jgi:hypothetical protein
MAESAILGTSFEEALGRHLTSSLIASLGAMGADEIGTHFDKTDALGKLNHKIAHAVLGCAMGAASADSSDGCAPGAVGAVIGELVAEWYGDATGYADLEQQRNAETDPIKRQALSEEVAAQKKLIIGISELAAVGGTAVLLQSGAEQLQLAKMTANNAVANNRQLHVDERVLARNLAAKSGGKFTVEQIENALRNSGNTAKGEGVDEGMVVRTEEERYDKGAVFNAGEQGSGTIVQELPNQGQVNADLASFIVANTGGSSSPYGWLDGQLGKAQPVASNPNAGLNTFTPAANGCASAECAGGVAGVKNAVRDVTDMRNDVADGAAGVSRGSGIVGSTATAASAIPGPHQPGAVTTALVATGVGFTADVIEQIARPDVGKGLNNFMAVVLQEQLDKKLPIVAPVTSEAIEYWKKSGSSQSFENWMNTQWSSFVQQRGAPQ